MTKSSLHLYRISISVCRFFFVSFSVLIFFSCSEGNKEEGNTPKREALPDTVKKVIAVNKTDSIKTTQEFIPETDYDSYSKKIVFSDKDVTEIKNWLKKIVKSMDFDNTSYLTKNCSAYTEDVMDFNWGYPDAIDEKTLKKKWSKKYDLKYSNFGDLFETGNGGWTTKEVTNITYLGELNGGDWFRLIIKGGPMENDQSVTIVRVVKVITQKNKFYIDNFLSLSDE